MSNYKKFIKVNDLLKNIDIKHNPKMNKDKD